VEQVPKPELRRPGDALVRVSTSSICGSDLHILHGTMPGVEPGTVVGHEFTGVVEEVSPGVVGFHPGDRVVGPAAVWCGECRACRGGLPMACEHAAIFGCGTLFGDLPGAQAEYVRVPFADVGLLKIPDDLRDDQAIFVGDILPTAYTSIVGITPGARGVRPGDTVVVIGAGPVGLCAVACARLFDPARVIAVDVEAYRLELAARLGADVVVDASREDAREVVAELTGGWGAEHVVEAVGRPETLKTALMVVAPGGSVSVVGVSQRTAEVPLHRLVARNVSLSVGMGNLGHMPELLRLVHEGALDLTPIVTHRLPLTQGPRGYEIFEKKLEGAVKVLLETEDRQAAAGGGSQRV
jgi:alcohol dehydrogenase